MRKENIENRTIIKWNIPSEPTIFSKKNIGICAKSSLLVGVSTMTAPIVSANEGVSEVLVDGIFWTMFQTYIYPWFLDIATVFVAIKIAQGFYQENRGGRDSGSGFNAVFTYGKWLLLFHMIPFFVKLMDEIGRTMSNHLG